MLRSGDVVDLDLGVPQGREAGFQHPAVVITAQSVLDADPAVIQVVPFTSTLRGFESEVTVAADDANGLDHDSAAQCQHIRAVARSRVRSTLGTVDPVSLRTMRETVATLIDLP